MTDDEATRRERNAQQFKELRVALQTAYPVEPSHSFNSDIASLLDAIDRRARQEER